MARRADVVVWDRRARRRRLVRGMLLVAGVGGLVFLSSHCAVRMPGESFVGPLPALSAPQKSLAEEMRADVEVLAGRIGERNAFRAEKLAEAERYLTEELRAAGYEVRRLAFVVKEPEGVEVANLEVEIAGVEGVEHAERRTSPGLADSATPSASAEGEGGAVGGDLGGVVGGGEKRGEVDAGGTPAPRRVGEREIVIVGAHYDSYRNCPAANDNGSGVAAVLALARRFAAKPGSVVEGSEPSAKTPQTRRLPTELAQSMGSRTLRFVLFVNEEPPYFWTSEMGSLVYAKACKERGEKIAAMLSIETIGYYSDEKGSQEYPPVVGAFYPSEGDFIGFVGLYESRDLVERCVGAFRESAPFPSQGAALTALVPRVASSDHWSFWKMGYPALMVTDTAPYRYPHYHKPTDTPDKLGYERMARVVEGLEGVVRELVNGPSSH